MVSFSSKMRDVGYIKPAKFKSHMTISEVAREVDHDISWIRRLERAGRIPAATRVTCGKLEVRLWSPAQVKEIKVIFSKMKRGNPHGKR